MYNLLFGRGENGYVGSRGRLIHFPQAVSGRHELLQLDIEYSI